MVAPIDSYVLKDYETAGTEERWLALPDAATQRYTFFYQNSQQRMKVIFEPNNRMLVASAIHGLEK